MLGLAVPVTMGRDDLAALMPTGPYDFVSVDSQHAPYDEERLTAFCKMTATLDIPVPVPHQAHAAYLPGWQLPGPGPHGHRGTAGGDRGDGRRGGRQFLLSAHRNSQLGRADPRWARGASGHAGVRRLVGADWNPLDADRVGRGDHQGADAGEAGGGLPVIRPGRPHLQPRGAFPTTRSRPWTTA